jgi:nucleoside-specific outer membrane channel protein Tsx
MSFIHKKMSQNLWATIMSFGPVTNILLAQNFFWLALISGTATGMVYVVLHILSMCVM